MFAPSFDGKFDIALLALHFDSASNHKRVKLFWTTFGAMFCYEVIPAYIFPLLNGINIVCLATQRAPAHTLNVITNLFGGTDGNEGLGLLSLSFDWQYITSRHVIALRRPSGSILTYSSNCAVT